MKNVKKGLEVPFQQLIEITTEILKSNKLPIRAVALWKLIKMGNPSNEYVQYVMERTHNGENFPVELGQHLRFDADNVATFRMSDGSRFFVFTIDKKEIR